MFTHRRTFHSIAPTIWATFRTYLSIPIKYNAFSDVFQSKAEKTTSIAITMR